MSLTAKGKGHYAVSMFDGRTQYSKSISNRTFDMNEVISEMSNRKPPTYVVGDEIKLADGTTRNVRFRTYSPSQGSWVYRLNTDQKNRYGGTLSTGNLTEQQVLEMDVSRKPSLKVSEQDGWIVQFKTTTESSEFRTWANDGGEVAIFEKEIAVYFAQSMVMAHDQLKQWAIFRVRPFEGYRGEQYFTTLVQPDGKYTAAIAHRAFYDGGNWTFLNADDEIIANYHHSDEGYRFFPFLAITWIDDSRESLEVQTYRNPCLPVFEVGSIVTLPTGFNRPVQFITPYWVEAGVVAFNYWFYIQDKQLVSYTGTELIWTDVDSVIDGAFETTEVITLPPFYAGTLVFMDGTVSEVVDDKDPIENFADSIRAEMQQEINSRDTRIKELEDALWRANKKVELIQAKEVQYENECKNRRVIWNALKTVAPHICKEIQPHLLETIEYDKMVGPIMMQNLEQKGTINHLRDVLLDILNCASTMSNDADDEWGWISYMANMGINGGHYNRDTMLPRFGIGEFPKHTLPIADEI